ncbi:MAG: hypothetical protein QM731_05785 [Chitinophagaceae bacterium]
MNLKTTLLPALFLLFAVKVNAQNTPVKKEIIEKLEHAYDLDQDIRQKFGKAQPGSTEYKMLRDSLRYIDSVNQSVVFPVLDQYGWMSSKEISQKASAAFYYVIQHAELPAQIKYARQIDKAYELKEISNLEYARFVDRLLFRQGKFQVYGLQSGADPLGNNFLYPVKDIKIADRERQRLGFGTIESEMGQSGTYLTPDLSEFKYPVVFIAHIAGDKGFQTPAKDIEIICDSKVIARSNERGMVYVGLNKPPGQDLVLTLQKDGKSRTYTLKGDNDFYEYWGMWN